MERENMRAGNRAREKDSDMTVYYEYKKTQINLVMNK